MILTLQDKVNWLQRFIIVHSYIYYEMNKNILEDAEYDRRARNLAKVKDKYPEEWKNSEYYKQFGDDYNGSTGFTLYYDLDDHQKEIIRGIANMIVRRTT